MAIFFLLLSLSMFAPTFELFIMFQNIGLTHALIHELGFTRQWLPASSSDVYVL